MSSKKISLENRTFTSVPSRLKVERMGAMLQVEALTRREISEELHVSPNTAWHYLTHLIDQKKVYIKHWERNCRGGRPTPYYAWGDAPDAPKPNPLEERNWAKDKYKAYLERCNERQKMKRAAIRTTKRALAQAPVDPMTAWIPRRTGA